MEGTTPKVSFIPKGSLVRETPFLERRRPRSVVGLVAGLVFTVSVGSFAGLSFYNDFLGKQVVAKTGEINLIRQKFSDAPQISKAQVFSSRAELAQDLLTRHTVVSPVFTFLSNSTIESIFYDKFSFVHDTDKMTLELSGEAPTYAALAYQEDVLRKKTKELSKFTVSNVSLTSFGTVAFTLLLTFTPEYLSYNSSLNRIDESFSQWEATATTSTQQMGTSTVLTGASLGAKIDTATSTAVKTATGTVAIEDTAPVQKKEESTEASSAGKQSAMKSFWSQFKFW